MKIVHVSKNVTSQSMTHFPAFYSSQIELNLRGSNVAIELVGPYAINGV